MPVNQAEIEFFKLMDKNQQNNPMKPIHDLSLEEYRESAAFFSEYAGKPASVDYDNITITARDAFDIPIRIYNNALKQKLPVLVFCPGCGYMLDFFEANAIACSRIAEQLKIKIAIVNYRLAPENPLPTAIYDVYDTVKFFATHHKEMNIDKDKIFLCGLSSGANATAIVSNLARSDDSFKIYRQILLNGNYDLIRSSHDFDDYEKEDKLLIREVINYICDRVCPNLDDRTNPLFSPYYEKDLTHLPPTTIIVSEYDGIRNDSEAYFKQLKEVGNDVESILIPGQTHNTILMRSVLSDGVDPATVIADVVRKHI
ncbi:MAG: alpha/beta hydrolase [Gammaproteobacteria bacterium]|nr:alpha/beta hydrolase [Gammaproteobacteria bacterium]